jgi:hypothetical protein
MSNSNVVVFRGKASFAKVLGDPVSNPFDDNRNWTIDLVLTPETVKEAKSLGIGDKVKQKDEYLDGQPFMTFRQAEYRKDGETKNDPIPVRDIRGNTWDQDKLIGNGSDIDLKFVVMDFGKGKKKGVYIRGIRVLKLVEYAGKNDFEPISEDDEFFTEAQQAATLQADRAAQEDKQFKKDFDLDDDIDDVL